MIVSRQNRKIKDIRRLRRCKGDRAILEGPHLVEAALTAGLTLDSALVTKEFLVSQIGRRLVESGLPEPVCVAPDLIEYLGDSDSPRGVVAVCELPRGGVETLPLAHDGTFLHIDGMQDPGNLGALVRVAEAFGVAAITLAPGSVHPNHPRLLRASTGSALRMRIGIGITAQELAAHLGRRDSLWVALTPRGGEALETLPSADCLVLAVGSEGPGLTDQTLALVDRQVTIPLAAPVESLNSTVAAAIALHAIHSRRDAT
jgi:TrmH family RNA methyltransferase